MARIALAKAQANLAAATLVAPFGGTVLDVKAWPGDRVNPGAPIIELADLIQLAEIVVTERKDVLVLPRRAIRARPYTTVSVPVLEASRWSRAVPRSGWWAT